MLAVGGGSERSSHTPLEYITRQRPPAGAGLYARSWPGQVRCPAVDEEGRLIGVAAVEAPWGPIHLATDADGLIALEVLTTEAAFGDSVRRRLGEPHGVPEPGGPTAAWPTATAAPSRPTWPASRTRWPARLLPLHGLTAWDRRVLDGVRDIPWGELTSYGRLARAIGRPGAARAVGGAVGSQPDRADRAVPPGDRG